MTVYVLQEMGRNIRSAEKFGDLKICLPDNRQMILSSGPLTFCNWATSVGIKL